MPEAHASHYEDTKDRDWLEFARIMESVIGAPFDTNALKHYHWHIEIVPSLTKMAGFELGGGFYINSVPLEEAAERLRKS